MRPSPAQSDVNVLVMCAWGRLVQTILKEAPQESRNAKPTRSIAHSILFRTYTIEEAVNIAQVNLNLGHQSDSLQ